MTPAKSPEYIRKDDCKDCRDGNRWWMRTVMTMMGLMLAGTAWSIPSVLAIQSEQAAQSKDDEWIKASLVRIEKRMDNLHLTGGE